MRPMSPVRSQSPNITLLGLIRPIPIAAHDLRSEHADFSDAVHRQFLAGVVADRDVGRGHGQADGTVEIQARGLAVAIGEVSVSPHPCVTMQPVTSFQRAATTPCSAMPPAKVTRRALKSTVSKPGVCSNALNSVLTPLMKLNLYFFSSATKALKSRGFVISTLRAPKREKGQAIAREREDMIQRQRGDDDARLVGLQGRVDPGRGLQHIGHHVAMGENRRLRDAGRAARVLQEGDVLGTQRERVELESEAAAQGALECQRTRHTPWRNLLAYVLQHEIHDEAVRHSQQVADCA